MTKRTDATLQQVVDGETDMLAFGARLAGQLKGGATLYISGDLGAGKTTLCRGILTGRGYHGNVKSPTYTLVEPYDLPDGPVYHFDLYRLADPSELEYMGYRDYLQSHAICLIEWPEKGAGWLPDPDLNITISSHKHGRSIECAGKSKVGVNIINNL